jgi:hypothetical protein
MVYSIRKIGKWNDYLYGDKNLYRFELVAKSILACWYYFGAMQP